MHLSRTKLAALTVWVGMLAIAIFEAPATRADVWPWVVRLSTGDLVGENPMVVALFFLMGVWPWLLAARLRDELLSRPVPALPFVLGANVLGAFVVAPWFLLRPTHQEPRPGGLLSWVGSAPVAVLLGAAGAAMLGWGLAAGDPSAFVDTFLSEGFVHVMTFDFVACHLLFVIATAQRTTPTWAWIPVVGSAIQLVREARAR